MGRGGEGDGGREERRGVREEGMKRFSMGGRRKEGEGGKR